MHAEHPLGALRVGGQPGHGQRVGAGGQDGVRAHHGVQPGEDLPLELVVLGHHLDDEIGVRGGLEIGEGTEPGQDVLPLPLRDPLALHRTGGGGFEGGDGVPGRGFVGVDTDDLAAGPGQHLGDAGAHGAQADDGDGGKGQGGGGS